MNSEPGPPATLGSTAAAQARIVVWCRDCRHQAEPDPAELARQYGADTPIAEWHRRLVCSHCGSRAIDFVLTASGRALTTSPPRRGDLRPRGFPTPPCSPENPAVGAAPSHVDHARRHAADNTAGRSQMYGGEATR
jgi:hypothetical protein